jgi:hypothetical protein
MSSSSRLAELITAADLAGCFYQCWDAVYANFLKPNAQKKKKKKKKKMVRKGGGGGGIVCNRGQRARAADGAVIVVGAATGDGAVTVDGADNAGVAAACLFRITASRKPDQAWIITTATPHSPECQSKRMNARSSRSACLGSAAYPLFVRWVSSRPRWGRSWTMCIGADSTASGRGRTRVLATGRTSSAGRLWWTQVALDEGVYRSYRADL